jgi:carbonic anhydrase
MLDIILRNNEEWVKEVRENNPTFFDEISKGQAPEVLWLGCSDSRVPPNEVTKLGPGRLFVHRNIANMVKKDDPNFISVLKYAVENLKVKHIVICGHYFCGGVQAAMSEVNLNLGVIETWIEPIKQKYLKKKTQLEQLTDPTARLNKMVEINVVAQVENLMETEVMIKARERGDAPDVNGLVMDLSTGYLKTVISAEELEMQIVS